MRISAKPGAIDPLTGPDTDGRNVLLKGGESVSIEVKITNAYGVTYIVADDLGYTPKDPLARPAARSARTASTTTATAPSTSRPTTGCAFANDDSEEGGTFGEGVSTPIYFKLPRIADVRGLKCDPSARLLGQRRDAVPARGRSRSTPAARSDGTFEFNTVVTRISSDGFYVSDRGDTRGTPPGTAGFNSVFAFNFNAPPRMRICDRMKTYGGTANEFFGFTQMLYPTWTLEEWDPARRPCLVPEPERLTPDHHRRARPTLLSSSANLVRVETAPDGSAEGHGHAEVRSRRRAEDARRPLCAREIRNADGTISRQRVELRLRQERQDHLHAG